MPCWPTRYSSNFRQGKFLRMRSCRVAWVAWRRRSARTSGSNSVQTARVLSWWSPTRRPVCTRVPVPASRSPCMATSTPSWPARHVARGGKRVAGHGALDTVMAGLACGEVSLLAWEILHPGVNAFLTIDDESAMETVRLLAAGRHGDAPLVAGESAVAGLAGCLGALGHEQVRAQPCLE